MCGSDLWPYRGVNPVPQPTLMGHEYCGIVAEVGSAVTSVKPGQFVIGSFFASDNTRPNCHAGDQSSCQHAEFAVLHRRRCSAVPLADGTLVATQDVPLGRNDTEPSVALRPHRHRWFAADAANVKPGSTVAVVGDGAVGQKLAREFGATDIVTNTATSRVLRRTAKKKSNTCHGVR